MKIKGKKLVKLLRAPFRILIRARDFYMRSLTDCSGSHTVGFGSIMGCPTGQISALPRSYSVNSTRSGVDHEDFRELVRAASARSSLGVGKLDQPSDIWSSKSPGRLPRSFSTGIGRIDEEKPCEFGEPTSLFPRSRSYAVNRRNAFL